jgi:hypothetical protein
VALAALVAAGCHSPGLYTSARPVETGSIMAGVALEPVVFLSSKEVSHVGPSATALLRVGTSKHTDFGIRFNAITFGWDFKIAPYLSDRWAIALIPGGRAGQGYWFHAPAVVSYDATSWLRLVATAGMSFSHNAYVLEGGGGGTFGITRVPISDGGWPDGWHGRLGLGLDLHSEGGFGVFPEVTYLQSTEPYAASSLFLALGVTFGRVGFRLTE